MSFVPTPVPVPPQTLDPISTLSAALQQSLTDARTLHGQNETKLDGLMPALNTVAGLAPYPALPFSTSERNDQQQDFRPQLVEVLFGEASQLLSGLLASRRAFRSLSLQQLNLATDIQELQKLRAINVDETAANIYNVPFWDARGTFDANQAALNGLTVLTGFLQGQQAAQELNAAYSAENSDVPFASNSTGGTIGSHTTKLAQPIPSPSGDETAAFGTSLPTDGSKLAALLAFRSASYGFDYAQQQQVAESAPASTHAPYLSARSAYLAADASFRERRRDAAFDKLVFKLSKVSQAGGASDFAGQLATLIRRATDDITNAYVRLQVVSAGMKIVYGHTCDPLPAAPAAPIDFTAPYLDSLVDWTRRVGLFLNRLLTGDQMYIHRISLRAQGPDFNTSRNNRRWTSSITATEFPSMGYLRLRGVAMSYDGAANIPPRFLVAAPQSATAVYGGGATASINQVIAGFPVGRPSKATSNDGRVDVCGASALFNASPIGQWQIRALTDVSGLSDLFLDLYLSVQVGV